MSENGDVGEDDVREEVVEEECVEVILDKKRTVIACSEEMNDRANSQNAVIQPLLTGEEILKALF